MAVPPLSEVNRNLFNSLIDHHIRFTLAKRRVQLTKQDWYRVTALVVRDMLVEKMLATRARFDRADAKKLYYLSLEFLIGRSLENNLFNLGLIEICRDFLAENGVDLQNVFDEEPDAALGNGGLGRLAACFLDSLATLDLPGYAYGINYEYGLFRQEIRGGYQIERPDAWQREISPWLVARPLESCRIPVYGRVEHRFDRKGRYRPIWMDQRILIGMPHDLPIAGFGGRTVNFVRLYSASASDEFDMQIFNAGDYMKAVEQKMFSENISKVLYPSDSVAAGRELRLLQEYFFVACAVQDIVRKYLTRGEDFGEMPAKVAIQLNDTHPALTIAELMRLFVDEQDIEWESAWEITRATVAYTNHTLMPEALERWPVSLLERVVPRHLQVIYEINRRFLSQVASVWSEAPERTRSISIIQDGNEPQVHMAKLAIVDPGLAHLLDATIGGGWTTDLEQLSGVEKFADNAEFQTAFTAIKRANKERLARIVNRLSAVDIDPAALFDVQAKRIHEYKRQLLMALGIVHQYLTLVDDGVELSMPRAYLLAGKAAPGYWAAKMIIKLINSLADVINNDPKTRELIKVAFLPDYRVSLAEKIIPAADLSEQISTAGREASGTGNMKFAMNGALTVGTLDGANIEIRDAVGAENIFIFGLTADKIEEFATLGTYHPREYYEAEPRLRRVLDELASDRFCPDEPGLFRWVRDVLLSRDEYFLLADFGSYVDTQSEISTQYQDRALWNKKAILNLSRIGYFSSDRAVAEYAREIWNLQRS